MTTPDLSTIANHTKAAVVVLTNDLLGSDEGIRESTYHVLIDMLSFVMPPSEVERLKTMVRATDGKFYFPEGVFFEPGKGSNDATQTRP
jgi:hypothetical protein